MKDLLIKNGRIITMGETGVIENGQVLIQEGVIRKVGTDVPSEGAETLDAQGGYVLPGMIDAHCHIGVYETGIGFPGDDGNELSDPITPQIRAMDGIYPRDAEFGVALRSGVTTVATGPGSGNPIGGQFVSMRTWGNTMEGMVLQAPQSMKMAFGENPKNCYGKSGKQPMTRMATAALIRESLYRTLEYVEQKDKARKEHGAMPTINLKYEALEPVVRRELQVKAHCHRTDDIMTAIRIAKEFNLKMSLEHCTEGYLIADEIAASGYPAILGPLGGFPQKPEVMEQRLEAAGILCGAGVKVAIMTDLPATHLWYLPMAAGMCVGSGLPEWEGFASITRNAADILGLGGRMGTIEPGKDGNIAIFDGNPIRDLWSRCKATVAEGEVRYRHADL